MAINPIAVKNQLRDLRRYLKMVADEQAPEDVKLALMLDKAANLISSAEQRLDQRIEADRQRTLTLRAVYLDDEN